VAEHKAKKKVAEAVWANQHNDAVEAQGLLLGELAEVVEGEEVWVTRCSATPSLPGFCIKSLSN